MSDYINIYTSIAAVVFVVTLCWAEKGEGILLNLLLAILLAAFWPIVVCVYIGCNVWDAVEAQRKIK